MTVFDTFTFLQGDFPEINKLSLTERVLMHGSHGLWIILKMPGLFIWKTIENT